MSGFVVVPVEAWTYTGHQHPYVSPADCRHERLGFHSGGWIVGCADCGGSWDLNVVSDVGQWYLGHTDPKLTMYDLRVALPAARYPLDGLREGIARVIEPGMWKLWPDDMAAPRGDIVAGQCRARAQSLTKADAILALIV